MATVEQIEEVRNRFEAFAGSEYLHQTGLRPVSESILKESSVEFEKAFRKAWEAAGFPSAEGEGVLLQIYNNKTGRKLTLEDIKLGDKSLAKALDDLTAEAKVAEAPAKKAAQQAAEKENFINEKDHFIKEKADMEAMLTCDPAEKDLRNKLLKAFGSKGEALAIDMFATDIAQGKKIDEAEMLRIRDVVMSHQSDDKTPIHSPKPIDCKNNPFGVKPLPSPAVEGFLPSTPTRPKTM